jgi:hypothetical protein
MPAALLVLDFSPPIATNPAPAVRFDVSFVSTSARRRAIGKISHDGSGESFLGGRGPRAAGAFHSPP